MSNRTSDARHALHEAGCALHDALDTLEANDDLRELDWLLAGADTLVRLAGERLEQIHYCLRVYGHTTTPPPIPLCAADARSLSEVRRAA